MKVIVFHGSPRKGNTYRATRIFMDALEREGEVSFAEYFLPASMPLFCTGCQACIGGKRCPHAQYVDPILQDILESDALIIATPHHGVSSMSASVKNLLDHLDFLALTVTPRPALFQMHALIISTGTGSASAIAPIRNGLKYWGINRVSAVALRMFTNAWHKMPAKRQARFERKLSGAAKKCYRMQKRPPYLSTRFMYHLSKFILRRYVGEGEYPYEYWQQQGYFDKCPL